MKDKTLMMLSNPLGAWVARGLIISLITMLGWGCKFWMDKNYQRIEQADIARAEMSAKFDRELAELNDHFQDWLKMHVEDDVHMPYAEKIREFITRPEFSARTDDIEHDVELFRSEIREEIRAGFAEVKEDIRGLTRNND